MVTNLSMRRIIGLGVLAILLPAANAGAWIDTGHKIIAMIVWDELTPAAKARVTEILKQHPRYEKDLLQNAPEGLSDADAAKYAFATAATWPDMVRSQYNPMHTLYNHPNWHYIDIPFVVDNQPLPPPHETATQDAAPAGPTNVVEALTKNVADLKDANVSESDKAIALCWVLHLIGDIHQPLHAAMLVSPQYPYGDQGGNLILVLRDPPYANSRTNLHLLWDELPGQYKSLDMDSNIAQGLRNDPRYTREKLKDALAMKDYMAWANESHELAVKYAYLDGKLQGANAHPKNGETRSDTIPGLPPRYVQTAEEIAMQRVILAGYRSADMLNEMFK